MGMHANNRRWEETMADKLSVAVGAGIAVAWILVLGSVQTSATPASGVALIPAIQKAEPVARYHIPRYRRCRYAGMRMDRYGHCIPSGLYSN
jgi:hypothetical protein